MDFIPSPNYSKGRAKPLRGIVLHTIVGSAASAIGHFKNPASQVSAHYVIAMDGTITQMVNNQDTAWHAGRLSNNQTIFTDPNAETIGIEHDDGGDPAGSPRSDALYSASAALVRALSDAYGIPLDRVHIVAHREIYSKKTCPGNLDIDRIIREAQGGTMFSKEEVVDFIYTASQGRGPEGAERAFALGGIAMGDLAKLRFRDDTVGVAWMASEGNYCPDSEKQFWLRYQEEHGGHPVETFGRTWYNDHVKAKLDAKDLQIIDLTQQRDAARVATDNAMAELERTNKALAQVVDENERLESDLNFERMDKARIERELATTQQQLEACRINGVDSLSASELIIRGIRKLLRIA